MRTVAWITLQLAIIAAAVWMDADIARIDGRAPTPGMGIALGVVFAFIVTGCIVVVRDKLLTRRSTRTVAPAGGVYIDAGPGLPALDSQSGQTGGEGERLVTSSRSGRYLPEGGSGVRVSE